MNLKKSASSDISKIVLPSHISWSVNGEQFAPIDNSPSATFEFSYKLGKKPGTFKQEIEKGVKRLAEFGPLAICVSGGDSEIIARTAHALGVEFELWFLDIWGLNSDDRENVEQLASDLEAPLNLVSLDSDTAYESVIPESFNLLGAAKPTYLLLPYLFNAIPEHMVIVGGEGDPQKSGVEYDPLAGDDGIFSSIPVSITEIYYKQWALVNNRKCEMNFYSSTPGLVRAYWEHPELLNKNGIIDTRPVVDFEFPDLIFKQKTTNWEKHKNENVLIRQYVMTLPTAVAAIPKATLANMG